MPPDVEAYADLVVLTIKATLAPVLERIAAAEARQAALGDVRDRLVAVETKAAQPLPVPDWGDLPARLAALEAKPVEKPVDLTPMLAAVAELTKTINELRDRVVTMETKAAQPPPVVDVGPVLERVAATEARLATLGDLRDRVVTIETHAAQPTPPDPAVQDLRDRVVAVETKVAVPPKIVDLDPLREQVKTLELAKHATVERWTELRHRLDTV
jgi:hypothetical protein